MKKLSLALAAIAVSFCIIVLGCNNSNTGNTGTDTKDTTATAPAPETSTTTETPAPPMDSAAMAKAWQEYMTPGDMHKMFASFNGKWEEDMTFWMAPEAPPQKSTATAENKMILGGRYTQSVHKGSFEGQPFEGISTMGYDNSEKQIVSTWMDNMGTGIMVMKGTWDEGSRTMNLKGTQTDPVTDKPMEVREVLKVVDDNTHLMEMYQTPQGGKEFKSMEIKFTRKK